MSDMPAQSAAADEAVPGPSSPSTFILPLSSERATLSVAGGKGANLALLARAGLPVPGGFVVTTEACRAFVAANDLDQAIGSALAEEQAAGPGDWEKASSRIRTLFGAGGLPEALASELIAAYATAGRPAVAVRSSATAEDLPEMSFAGQQDTFLNVSGEQALLRAVVDCWASLWTARAIAYRARNGVPHAGAALAVVVQMMVESQASGVLFTANPLTGLRSETVIDAALGLGEALVSGQVEPDHYVVDTAGRRITAVSLGAKAASLRSRAGGGTERVVENARDRPALPDAQILALAALGQQVAALYGTPQDIEWAWAGDKLYVLQARPITSLFPLPEDLPPEPLKVLFSAAAVQGMLDPITPLGRDTLREIFAGGASLFGMRVTRATQTVLVTAGERLWLNMTPLLRNTVGRKVVRAAVGTIEPTIQQALAAVWDDPALQPAQAGLSRRARLQLARFALPVAGNVLLNLSFPARRRALIVRQGDRLLDRLRARCRAAGGEPHVRLAQLAVLVPDYVDGSLPHAFRLFVSGVASAMAAFNLLNRQASDLPGLAPADARSGWSDLVLTVVRGVPNNPTTEMDLELWQVARQARSDPAARDAFGQRDAGEMAAAYAAGTLPQALQSACDRFLARYGARGLAEFDLGRARWSEDPAHLFAALAGYLQIEDESQAPDAVFRRGAAHAGAAIDRLAAAARRASHGRLRALLVRFLAGRARALMGIRESPKFFAVRMMDIVRQELLAIGRELVAAGELALPDDLIYLTWSEIAAFAAGEARDWPYIINRRREAQSREGLRRQIPKLLLSDGRAFYGGLVGSEGNQTLAGSPVSPGLAEGRVRVVLDPRTANLRPGEVLVCPGTDPSWTPLFLIAGALVMEVGGMMTHGAVVAREYGIPAVVGVHEATTRLQTGQRVRVDGSSGLVLLLNEDSNGA